MRLMYWMHLGHLLSRSFRKYSLEQHYRPLWYLLSHILRIFSGCLVFSFKTACVIGSFDLRMVLHVILPYLNHSGLFHEDVNSRGSYFNL